MPRSRPQRSLTAVQLLRGDGGHRAALDAPGVLAGGGGLRVPGPRVGFQQLRQPQDLTVAAKRIRVQPPVRTASEMRRDTDPSGTDWRDAPLVGHRGAACQAPLRGRGPSPTRPAPREPSREPGAGGQKNPEARGTPTPGPSPGTVSHVPHCPQGVCGGSCHSWP